MRAIRELADRHHLFLLEDNAQAIDARGDDFRIGELFKELRVIPLVDDDNFGL